MKNFSIESITPVEPVERQIIVRQGSHGIGPIFEVHDENDGGYRAEGDYENGWNVVFGSNFEELSANLFDGFERFYDPEVPRPETIQLRYKGRTMSYTLV